ncbi:MAG: hypothetical protein JWN72_761 [Thermoleophilia bacterium]|nr:hypothetical protein [Thermoleophilia bacterium]
MKPNMSPAELLELPPTLAIPFAGSLIGLGRVRSYEESKLSNGMLPSRMIGSRRRVVLTGPFLEGLGIHGYGQPSSVPRGERH